MLVLQGSRTLHNLQGVDPRLVFLIGAAMAISPTPVVVVEGLRSRERQRALVERGASQTMNSKHVEGKALDVALFSAGGEYLRDFEPYRDFAAIVKSLARKWTLPVVWGGDWRTLRDGPHFELQD